MSATVLQRPQLTNGRLLLLGVSSVVLCISFIMSLFAPFPLAMATILYGRTKAFAVGALGLLLTFGFSAVMYKDVTLFGFYFLVLVLGLGIGEIVIRGFSPVKGIVVLGLSFITLTAASLGFYLKSQNVTLEQFIIRELESSSDKLALQKEAIEKSTDKNSIEVLQLLDRPDLLAKQMMESLPMYFFVGVFVLLWFNMFLALKSRRLLLSHESYQYSEGNLLNFKVPFAFILVLIAGLVMALFGKDYGLESWGMLIVQCLGIFYFFQGFGVFSDLLTFIGVTGFFRTLIVMIVIFMANYMIAAAGLFDNWFDFRKYFVKRKTDN
jgi:hypothetical protein